MEMRYRSNEYYYFVGRTLVDTKTLTRRVIQRMETAHDTMYKLTNGYYGNAYCIYLMEVGSDIEEVFHFRNFIEVIEKYGELDNSKPAASLTVPPQPRTPPAKKWAKIYPETYWGEKCMV
jgi:hypothetical protein